MMNFFTDDIRTWENELSVYLYATKAISIWHTLLCHAFQTGQVIF